MRIRREQPTDVAAVQTLNRQAFGGDEEARIIEVVRHNVTPIISLVTDDDNVIVGHILFSPVTLAHRRDPLIMGLAPMATLPSRQRQGIGTALVNAGLEECRRLGAVGVVVVGHPEYYPRFGFVPASRFGLTCEFEVQDNVFMAVALGQGFAREGGIIRYDAAFVS